jgi:hypothetical protein
MTVYDSDVPEWVEITVFENEGERVTDVEVGFGGDEVGTWELVGLAIGDVAEDDVADEQSLEKLFPGVMVDSKPSKPLGIHPVSWLFMT